MREPSVEIKYNADLLRQYRIGRHVFEQGLSCSSLPMFPGATIAGWLDALADKLDAHAANSMMDKPHDFLDR